MHRAGRVAGLAGWWGKHRLVAVQRFVGRCSGGRAAPEQRRSIHADSEQSWNLGLIELASSLGTSGEDVRSSGEHAIRTLRELLHARYVNIGLVDRLRRVDMILDDALGEFPKVAAALRDEGASLRSPISEVIETGTPVTLHDRPTVLARYAALANVLPPTIGSVVAVPLVDRLGTVIGALGVVMERSLAEESDALLSRATAAADVLSRHLTRVRWTEGATALTALAAQLVTAETEEAIAACVADANCAVVDAARSTVTMVRDGEVLRFFGDASEVPMVPQLRDLSSLELETPAVQAVRSVQSIIIQNLDDCRQAFPALVAERSRAGVIASVAMPVVVDGKVAAVLELAWTRPIRHVGELSARLSTLRQLIELAIAKVRGLRADAALAHIASTLAKATSVSAVAAAVVRDAAGPLDADLVVLILDRDEDRSHVLYRAADDAAQTDNTAQQRIPRGGPVSEALATEHIARMSSPSALELARVLDRDDVEQFIAVPLHSDRHRVGTLVYGWMHAGDLSAERMTLLTTVGELCGQSLSRAIVYAASQDVAALAERLTSALSVKAVSVLVHEWLPRIMSAQAGRLALYHEPTGRVSITYTPSGYEGVLREVAARYRTVSVSEVLPITDAIRRSATIIVADHDQLVATYPEMVEHAMLTHTSGIVAAPVLGAEATVLGGLAVAWSGPALTSPAAMSLLHTVARLTGQTLERLRTADAEHALARHLTERLAGSPPQIEGFRIGVRYEPALLEIGLGGDWYQVLDLGDERVAVVVGDVVGHGIEAAADMAYLRTVTGTLLQSGSALVDLFAEIDALSPRGTMVATIAAAVIDRRRETITVALAGHPPPLLMRPNAAPARVGHDERRTPIGLAGRSPLLTPLPFPHGSFYLAYTDGVVEQRGASIDEQIDRLADILCANVHLPVERIMGELLRPVLSANRDDIAMVLIKSEGHR